MINNRQGGRRGRGRNNNGARPQNGAPRTESGGNRIDNRSRGNANQLHEKYKTLARDAQMQGDRVMTEYYLQFADHYFRILNETRARFEEQRRPRDEAYAQGPYGTDLDYDGEDDGEDMMEDRVDPRGSRQPERGDEGERVARFDGRGDRQRDGRDRDGQQGNGQPRDPQQRDGQQRDGQSRDGQQRDNQQRDGQERYERQPREDRSERQPRARDDDRQPERAQGEGEGRREGGRQDRTRRDRQPERDGNRRDRAAEPTMTNAPQAANEAAPPASAPPAPPASVERIDVTALPPSLSLPLPEPGVAEGAQDGAEPDAPRRRRRRTKAEMEAARAAAAAETGDVAA